MRAPHAGAGDGSGRNQPAPIDRARLLVARARKQAERGEGSERADYRGEQNKRDAVLPGDAAQDFDHESIQQDSRERSVNEAISLRYETNNSALFHTPLYTHH